MSDVKKNGNGPIVGLVAAIIIGGLAYWVFNSGHQAGTPATILSAKHTPLVAQIHDLNKALAVLHPVIEELAEEEPVLQILLTPNAEDKAGPDGWQNVGLDPSAGLALAIDNRLKLGDQVQPLLVMRFTDRDQFFQFLGKIGDSPPKIESLGSMEKVTFEEQVMLMGEKSGYQLMVTVDEGLNDGIKKAFTQVLEDELEPLDAAPYYQRSLKSAGKELVASAYVNTDALGLSIGSDDAMTKSIRETIKFYASFFPAFALQIGTASATAMILTTAAGNDALRQLMVPKKRPPQFTPYISPDGWNLFRLSLNIDEMLTGLASLLPPTAPEGIRDNLGMVRLMLPLSLGVSYEAITKAFSGHMMVGALMPQFAGADSLQMESMMNNALFMLGIQDTKAADTFLNKTLARIAEKGGITLQPTSIAGASGQMLDIMGVSLSAVRHEEVILLGTKEAIAAAIQRFKGQHLKSPAAQKSIDGDVLFGAWNDLTPAVTQLPTLQKALDAKGLVKNGLNLGWWIRLDQEGAKLEADLPLSLRESLRLLAALEDAPSQPESTMGIPMAPSVGSPSRPTMPGSNSSPASKAP